MYVFSSIFHLARDCLTTFLTLNMIYNKCGANHARMQRRIQSDSVFRCRYSFVEKAILTNGSIAGVYLRDARTEPIISISAECEMFRQVADLTRLTAFLDMKHLNNVFLCPITPCKPRLAKADVASHADKRGATDIMFTARTATLGLTSSYDLYVGPNYRGSTRQVPASFFGIEKNNGLKFHVTRCFDSRESKSLFTSPPSQWCSTLPPPPCTLYPPLARRNQ